MMSSELKSSTEIFQIIQTCGICNKDIRKEVATYQGGFQFGIICSSCHANNSEEDIELMSNMFLAFGGFFGMQRDPNFPVNEMLKDLLDEIHVRKETTSPKELKLKLMYLALLHGITPQEFIAWDENLLKFMYNF
ncbi:MAG: hypothetical protein ACW986_17985 [Promethearchaeota archaeon]|jgi:hypothetical protein